MKNIMYALLIIAALVSAAPANIITHGIGLRFGSATEVIYQEYPGPDNRIEVGLGGGVGWFFGLTVTYKWNWKITDDLSWYAGPCGQFRVLIETANGYGIGGQAGIEYDLNAIHWPFVLSLDTRPVVGLREKGETADVGLNVDLGLSVRYAF